MTLNWSQLLIVGIALVTVESLSTVLLGDVAKAPDQAMRPKAKRAQEILMFGNQQNRRTENPTSQNVFAPTAEKRTLGTSGLEDVKAALTEGETLTHAKHPSIPIFDRERLPPYEKNYDYGKVMMSEITDNLPRNWDMPPYARYFGLDEDRRKRSDGKNSPVSTAGAPFLSTTVQPPSTSPPPLPAVQSTPRSFAPAKRSLPMYQEPRYKRALDREDLLALLSLWENGPRARNWRSYGNDEYENIEDDGNLIGIDDEDQRAGAWLEGPVYTPHHFNLGPEITSSDIGIPRTHPVNSYEQYGSQYGPAYETTQYGTTQYGALYPHSGYYPPEKRFIVSRKRSQGYDSYNGRNLNDIVNFSQMMNSQPQGYPNIPQRLFY